MPFNLRETFGGLYHLKLGLERRCLRRSQTHFLESLKQKGLNLKAVKNGEGKVASCHICGFALAELEMDGGRSVQACSATEPFRMEGGTFDPARTYSAR